MSAGGTVPAAIIAYQLCPSCMGPLFTHSPSSGPCLAVSDGLAEEVAARYDAVAVARRPNS